MKEFEYKPQYQYLDDAIINVTDDCNLQCRYCFVEQHPHYMTLETAKDIADWVYENNKKKKSLGIAPQDRSPSIYFFGGEPMLCYDSIIVPLVEYCKEKYGYLFKFGITTNGTLLNKDRIDFFKENNFRIMLSMDGLEETQCYNRPCKNKNLNSFELVNKNIPYLLEQISDVVYRSTAYPPTIEHLFDNYIYAEKMGFQTWACIADARSVWPEDKQKIFAEQMAKIYSYRLNQVMNHIMPMKSWRHAFWMKQTALLLTNGQELYNKEDTTEPYRCGLGCSSGAIGYDGSIYGCQEQSSHDEKNVFYIGNIYQGGINVERHTALLKKHFNSQMNPIEKNGKCKHCCLNNICKVNTLTCLSSNLELYDEFDSLPSVHCMLRQEYIRNSIATLMALSQYPNDEFVQKFLRREIR